MIWLTHQPNARAHALQPHREHRCLQKRVTPSLPGPAPTAKLTEALGLSAVELGHVDEGGRLIQAPNALVLRNFTELPLTSTAGSTAAGRQIALQPDRDYSSGHGTSTALDMSEHRFVVTFKETVNDHHN